MNPSDADRRAAQQAYLDSLGVLAQRKRELDKLIAYLADYLCRRCRTERTVFQSVFNVPGGQPMSQTYCKDCFDIDTKGIALCPLHAAALAMLEALDAVLDANDELMTEYISKKRAANWGVINDAGVKARAAIAQAKGETNGRRRDGR